MQAVAERGSEFNSRQIRVAFAVRNLQPLKGLAAVVSSGVGLCQVIRQNVTMSLWFLQLGEDFRRPFTRSGRRVGQGERSLGFSAPAGECHFQVGDGPVISVFCHLAKQI